jgi:hypothetical protein
MQNMVDQSNKLNPFLIAERHISIELKEDRPMSRKRWVPVYGLALLTFITVSCSQPAQNATRAQSSPTASAADDESSRKPDGGRARPEEPKAVREVPKQRPEPVKPAAAPRPAVPPAPAAPPAAPAPASAPSQAAASAPTPPTPIYIPGPDAPIPVPPPAPPPEPTTKQVTIPAGTEVYIRTIDSIDAEQAHPNENFRASLDKPIMVDNQTIIPRRSDVTLKVIEAQTAGKLKGQSELQVQLDRLFIGKQSYTVTSNTFTETGASEGKKAAKDIGIGAAVGGILGGILGGKKGAIIGAGAGGGGGAVLTKPEQVHIAPETQMLFKLENPLDVTITTAPPAATKTSAGGADGPARLSPPPDRPSRSSSPGPSSNQDDLSGTWTVTTDGAQYMTLQLSLRQNGNNLQGSITNPNGPGTLQIRGSVNGNYVTFSTQSQYGGYNQPLQFSGAIQGDSMQGNATIPANNGGYGNTGGYPGGGYPGRTGRTGGSTQVRWSAQRN